MAKSGKVLKWVFWIWTIVMVLLQFANLFINGVNRGTLAVVSEMLIFAWFGFVYFLRNPLSKIIKIIPNRYSRFVVVGYLSTVVAELVYMFSLPMHRNVAWDLILTAPWYVLWMIFWYKIIRKYDYSLVEAFILAVIHGFIVEGLLNNPLLALIGMPLFIALYGCFFIVPYLLMKDDFKEQHHVSLWKKIKMSFIPLIALIIGFIWILILVKIFGLTLH